MRIFSLGDSLHEMSNKSRAESFTKHAKRQITLYLCDTRVHFVKFFFSFDITTSDNVRFRWIYKR